MKTNRISKNVKALILSGLIIGSTSMVNIASADTIEKNTIDNNGPINIMSKGNDQIEIKEITRDEYVKNMAENEGITIQQADKIAEERTEKALEEMNEKMPQLKNVKSARSNIVWRQASWKQSYPKNKTYKAELVASFEVWTGGSFRQINSCTVGSSLAAGEHDATWIPINYLKTTSFPVTRATVGVNGKFQTTVTTGGGASISIPGFSVSGTGSKTKTFVSNTMTIQKEWSVY